MPEQASLELAAELRPVTIRMDSMIRLPADLPASVLDALERASTFDNPEHARRRRLGLWPGAVPRTISLAHREADGSLSAPRALTGQLRAALAAAGLRARWDDARVEAPLEREFHFSAEWEERPYQRRLADLVVTHQNVLAHSPTGSGKTAAGLLVLATLRQRTIAVMGRRQLVRQWVEDCERFLGFTPRVLGTGKARSDPQSSPLTVATQPALYRCAAREAPHFGALVMDEVAHGSARTYREVLCLFPARWRLGVSDDSTRHDGAEGMTYAHFGRPLDEVPVEDLVERGEFVPVALKVVPTGWVPRDSDGVPIPMGAIEPHERQARMVADEARNQTIAAWVLQTCGEANAGLILSYRVAHAEWFHRAINRAGVRCGLLLGGVHRRAESDRAVAELRDGRVRLAAGTIGAVGEGFNVKRLDRGYLALAGSQNKQALQQMVGRFVRESDGKGTPQVYVFVDGLQEPDARLTESENRAHRGWAAAQVAGLRALVRRSPARYASAEILGRDGKWWPLLREK